MAAVPGKLEKDLARRDKTPLGRGTLLRLQKLSMGPGIARNARLVVMEDGRCFYAHNVNDGKSVRGAVFNVPMPGEPSMTLPQAAVAEIKQALDEVKFFEEEPYVARENVRDGSLAIVTARRDGEEHEVWYMRVRNPLVDLLGDVIDGMGEQSTWADLLEEQVTLRGKLEER